MKGYTWYVKPGCVSDDRAGGQDNACYGMVNGSDCALSPLVLACVDGWGLSLSYDLVVG